MDRGGIRPDGHAIDFSTTPSPLALLAIVLVPPLCHAGAPTPSVATRPHAHELPCLVGPGLARLPEPRKEGILWLLLSYVYSCKKHLVSNSDSESFRISDTILVRLAVSLSFITTLVRKRFVVLPAFACFGSCSQSCPTAVPRALVHMSS